MVREDGERRIPAFALIGAALSGAALLVIGSGVAAVFNFEGAPARDRIFFGAGQGAGVFTALLALGAVTVTIASSRLGVDEQRWTRVSVGAAAVVAVVVIAAAAYSIWYVLSLHIQIPDPNSNEGIAISFTERAWSARVTEILQAAAAALLGVVTLVSARRSGTTGRAATQAPIIAT